MKTVAIALSALVSLASAAPASACLGEAQIITKVASSAPVIEGACLVKIQPASFYNESQACPLNYADVVEAGVLVAAKANCPAADSTLTGILVLRQDGSIVLE